MKRKTITITAVKARAFAKELCDKHDFLRKNRKQLERDFTLALGAGNYRRAKKEQKKNRKLPLFEVRKDNSMP